MLYPKHCHVFFFAVQMPLFKYLPRSLLKIFLCFGEDRYWQHVPSITTLAGCENWKKYLSSNQQSTLDSGIYFYFSIKIGTLGHDLEFQN